MDETAFYCLYSDKEELMKLQNNGSERKAQLMELKRKTEEAVKTSIKDYEMNKNALLDVYSHLKEKVGVSVNVKTTLNFKYDFFVAFDSWVLRYPTRLAVIVHQNGIIKQYDTTLKYYMYAI